MAERLVNFEAGFGILKAQDGATEEVFFVMRLYEADSNAHPLVHYSRLDELDFRGSKKDEHFKSAGLLELATRSGKNFQIQWHLGRWDVVPHA